LRPVTRRPFNSDMLKTALPPFPLHCISTRHAGHTMQFLARFPGTPRRLTVDTPGTRRLPRIPPPLRLSATTPLSLPTQSLPQPQHLYYDMGSGGSLGGFGHLHYDVLDCFAILHWPVVTARVGLLYLHRVIVLLHSKLQWQLNLVCYHRTIHLAAHHPLSFISKD